MARRSGSADLPLHNGRVAASPIRRASRSLTAARTGIPIRFRSMCTT
jgi:hypothetical protein